MSHIFKIISHVFTFSRPICYGYCPLNTLFSNISHGAGRATPVTLSARNYLGYGSFRRLTHNQEHGRLIHRNSVELNMAKNMGLGNRWYQRKHTPFAPGTSKNMIPVMDVPKASQSMGTGEHGIMAMYYKQVVYRSSGLLSP